MRVGMLGTGDVGVALGDGFIATGHEVRMGSRDAANEKASAWARGAGPRASIGTFADAAGFGELVVLATLGTATESVLGAIGPGAFKGKVVIDTTNPLDFSSGGPRLALRNGDSLGERFQKLLPGAHVVKAFNTVGHAHMFRPSFPGGPPDMVICGDDEGAKKKVGEILKAFGWGVVDIGGINDAHYVEALCMPWILYGLRTNTWDHAFKLLRKHPERAG